MPRFSLVIPTLKRPDTLRHALATLVAQDFDDFEIVVQNNGNDAETATVVASFHNSHIRHFSSAVALKMPDNWEVALNNARGEFISFVGDDDGMFPDACAIAEQVLASSDASIISWLPHLYHWPNSIEPPLRSRLVALVDTDVVADALSSYDHLKRLYRFAIDYSQLPMIYNSFISRSVIEAARKSAGRYFLANAPDVASGIINAALTDTFVRISRPLSIAGLSGHSTGRNMFAAPKPLPEDRLLRDFGTMQTDERIPESNNIEIFLAKEMLILYEQLSFANRNIPFDWRGLVDKLAATINDRPGGYDETLNTINQLAAQHDIMTDNILIPDQTPNRPNFAPGIYTRSSRQQLMVIDGSDVGINNIAEAVSWMAPLRPPIVWPMAIRQNRSGDYLSINLDEEIGFSHRKCGVSALFSGWGSPEDWGVWSVAKRARLRFRVNSDAPLLQATLRSRVFVHETHPQIVVTCVSRGAELAKWHCQNAKWEDRVFDIPRNVQEIEGMMELDFLISDPRSPASLGLSPDSRQLGLGIALLSFAKKD